jgi:hypothetical protein
MDNASSATVTNFLFGLLILCASVIRPAVAQQMIAEVPADRQFPIVIRQHPFGTRHRQSINSNGVDKNYRFDQHANLRETVPKEGLPGQELRGGSEWRTHTNLG